MVPTGQSSAITWKVLTILVQIRSGEITMCSLLWQKCTNDPYGSGDLMQESQHGTIIDLRCASCVGADEERARKQTEEAGQEVCTHACTCDVHAYMPACVYVIARYQNPNKSSHAQKHIAASYTLAYLHALMSTCAHRHTHTRMLTLTHVCTHVYTYTTTTRQQRKGR